MNRPRDIKDVKQLVKDNDIRFVRLWFADIHGVLKGFSIAADELEEAFTEGMGFDGSSIHGFARSDESDMIAKPDAATFAILPWRPREKAVARMFCDIHLPDGSPYPGDPRLVLKKAAERAKDKGYAMRLGPEIEFFYFKSSEAPEPLDHGGYFDLTMDAAEDLRRDTILCLDELGIRVEYSHHEGAYSQHEIDLRHLDALEMADAVMTCRVAVKEIAKRHGVYATFMPKPIFNQNGSGMHTHLSLFNAKDGQNAFFDANDKHFLSQNAKLFTAGLLTHIKEITLALNQWVNSYKRLVPGFESPAYICWAMKNRSSLVRIPLYKPGKEAASRIELRSPDPACNPYLAFACMLEAGMTGIEKKYRLPEPVERDIYHLSIEERRRLRLDALPGSLIEAIEVAEKSELMKLTLGEHVHEELIMSKRNEWDRFRALISPYELDTYLPML